MKHVKTQKHLTLSHKKKGKRIDIFEKFNPSWLGSDLEGMTLKCLGEGTIKYDDGTTETCEKLTINPEDMVIIPEGFPNVMEKFAQFPCKKVVLAQSWYYILNSMSVNQNWQQFGIKDVISVSDGISEYLNAIMPGLNIKQYSQSIDRTIFQPTPYTKKFPKIAFMPGRSQEAVLKTFNVIKTFYCFYPQFKWIRFDELKGLSKEEFAERLSESAFALYTDEIAGFGTMPLEAMACGTHVMGWTPLGGKEYMNQNNGFWAHNGEIFQLAELMGIAVERYLSGQLDAPGVIDEYERTLARYTPENEKEGILNIYNEYKHERIAELEQLKQQ
jgi:glycosyltransferase involved in cell wall biosynthesis